MNHLAGQGILLGVDVDTAHGANIALFGEGFHILQIILQGLPQLSPYQPGLTKPKMVTPSRFSRFSMAARIHKGIKAKGGGHKGQGGIIESGVNIGVLRC